MSAPTIRRFEHQGAAFVQRPGTSVVLMTGTLVPPVRAVARADPQTRMQDYCDALSFYLALPADQFDRIVFADNSDADFGALAELVQRENVDKCVELLSFQANDHSPSLGKAFGEFRILDIAIASAHAIKPGDHIWKVTGRLRCQNIAALDARCSDNDDIVCDLYNLPFVRSKGRDAGRGTMELRLFRCTPVAYDKWVRHAKRTGAGAFDEHRLFQLLQDVARTIKVRKRFPLQPAMAGVSGRTQRDYQSPSQRTKDLVRSIARRVTPWLWL
jgi:hypothetical protein